MSTSTVLMTAAELLDLPRGRHRYELINGELKTMSPSEVNDLLPGFRVAVADIFK